MKKATLDVLASIAQREWDEAAAALAAAQAQLVEHDAMLTQMDDHLVRTDHHLENPSMTVGQFQNWRAHQENLAARRIEFNGARPFLEERVSAARDVLREKTIAREKWKMLDKQRIAQEQVLANKREQKETDELNNAKAARRRPAVEEE
mgnify:FL=1